MTVYTQKLCARKAASVKQSQRFRLRVKWACPIMSEVKRPEKAKNAVDRSKITNRARRYSGIDFLLAERGECCYFRVLIRYSNLNHS